jgi:hypothetical protein
MRALTTILFATTTLLSGLATTTATAADLSKPDATLQQMKEVEGQYALSDGRRARIFVMDARLYLDLGRHYKELEPAGPDSWVTRDRSLSLQFRQGQAGNQFVLHNRNDLPDAAPVRLASVDRRGRGAGN